MVLALLGAFPYGSVAILSRVALHEYLYSTWVTIVTVRIVTWWPGIGVRPGAGGVGFSYYTTSQGNRTVQCQGFINGNVSIRYRHRNPSG